MIHAIPETAKRLADAGFPQPTPKRGQVWYSRSGHESYIIILDECGDSGICDLSEHPGGRVWADQSMNSGQVFAPSATDILQHLPGWNLCYTTQLGWQCWWDDEIIDPKIFSHSNPVEAAAQAWFYENEKK
jgi:hypothetical protein